MVLFSLEWFCVLFIATAARQERGSKTDGSLWARGSRFQAFSQDPESPAGVVGQRLRAGLVCLGVAQGRRFRVTFKEAVVTC